MRSISVLELRIMEMNAVITSIAFVTKKDNKPYNAIHKASSIEEKNWKKYYTFSKNTKYYLSPGKSKKIGFITKEFVEEKNASYIDFRGVYKKEIEGIRVVIQYQDVYGKKQPTYKRNN